MRRQFSARDCGGAELISNVLTRTQTQDTRRFPAAILRAFLVDALRACGLSEADTSTVANAMLEADLTGSDAHGIFRLAGYVLLPISLMTAAVVLFVSEVVGIAEEWNE